MQKYKNSIRDKISSSTFLVLLLMAFTLGIAGVFVVHKLAQTTSEQIIIQRCEKEALRFENKLNLVSHSVKMVNAYAKKLNKYEHLSPLSKEFEDQVKDLAISIANDTDGAMAVYFRYNPELKGNGIGGFFWSRKIAGEAFKEETPTDISAYPSDDVEHVGWFFTPKETGKPSWMLPYYNKNIDVLMVSYIVPMYMDNGTFLGVVGMDIDLSVIMDTVAGISVYKTGSFALINLAKRIMYYCDEGGKTAEAALSENLYGHIERLNTTGNLLEIEDEYGKEYVSCGRNLSNGLIMFLKVPLSEINANRNDLILIMLFVSLVIIGIANLLIRINAKKITRPINRLVDVANNYACNKWEEKYVCESGDELQELSETISNMADQIKSNISRLNEIARFDSMTGIRNKTSYMEMVEEIKMNRNGKYNDYAVAVMDLNFLKKANDTFGHEAGDALIKEASKYICVTFKHSPVFRVGGDEFVVILMGIDYENMKEKSRAFEQGMGYEVCGIRLFISYGIARSDEVENNFDKAFNLADNRMYKKKAEMKRSFSG